MSGEQPPDPVGAFVLKTLFRLEVIEAALELEKATRLLLKKAAAAGVDEDRPAAIRHLLLHEITRSVDLHELEHVAADGRLIGVITAMRRQSDAPPPFDVQVHLKPGGTIDLSSLTNRLSCGYGYLRLPGSTEHGFAATLEALRDRLAGVTPF
jgi:hypothetical protein